MRPLASYTAYEALKDVGDRLPFGLELPRSLRNAVGHAEAFLQVAILFACFGSSYDHLERSPGMASQNLLQVFRDLKRKTFWSEPPFQTSRYGSSAWGPSERTASHQSSSRNWRPGDVT